ncbi:MAG TPA: DEAD/DEAH box helicase [Kofleriaceae bacterium]|nr:DEAD/DEAH box helicase [Kofleriaceae bacterium]
MNEEMSHAAASAAAAPDTGIESTATAETERSEPKDTLPTFADLGIAPPILQALSDMGFEQPMEVQAAVFEKLGAGVDLMVQARTGTGKTSAFGIPIAQRLMDSGPGARVLILAPTRELALQVSHELSQICAHIPGLTVVPIYGGAPMKKQIDQLAAGAQIIAGTPGRVLDHIRRKTLDTRGIGILVLDECDEMLSMGFAEEIDRIIDTLPDKTDRQTLLFSATIPDAIERIARRHMREPERISLSTGGISVDEIEHYYYVVSGMARTRDLLTVMKTEKPESALIFCNTRDDTTMVAKFLARNGYDARAISSDLSQREREEVMGLMRDRKLKFLVATDIAARGIDISDLSHVINFTFPESPEVYVHRTGRTGRAGKRGVAISLVGPREIGAFYYLKLIYKLKPEERELPRREEVAAKKEVDRLDELLARVPETPAQKSVALARKLLASPDGERVVGALIERALKAAPAPAKEAAPAPVKEVAPRPEAAAASEAPPSVESRDGRERRPEREPRGSRTRTRGRRRRRDRDSEARFSAPRPGAAGGANEVSRDDATAEDLTIKTPAPAPAAEASAAPSGQDAAPAAADKPPTRRARASAPRPPRPAAGSAASEEPKEFWETWAEEKVKSREHGDEPVATASAATDESTAAEDKPTRGGRGRSARLYINIGRKDDLSADDVRALLTQYIADTTAKLGSVALRNTHCYVRVPEAIADEVISSATGQPYKDRELIVERARR